MIPYIYHPVLFSVLGFKIYAWGFIVAVGFLLSILLAKKYSKIEEKHLYNIALIAVLAGILGGRLLYFAYMPSEFGFLNFFRFWQGGMSFYGGFIFSGLAIMLYLKKNKLNILRTFDELTPWMIFGFAIGRVACLIGDGGHVGKATNFFLGVMVNGAVRHLTALYSLANLIVLFLIILILRKYYLHKTGAVFSFFLMYYGITRFVIDIFRADTVYFGLTIAQYLSIAVFLTGVVIWKKVIK